MNKPVLPGLYLTLVLLFIPLMRLAAQQENPMFYKEVILQHRSYTLHTLTRELQRQSGITFSYDAVKINPNRKIKVRQDRMTVRTLLSLIRKKTGIAYKVVSRTHIIYTLAGTGKTGKVRRQKRTGKGHAPPPREQTPMNEEGDDESTASAGRPAFTGGEDSPQIVVVGDSATAASYYFNGGGGGGGSYAGHAPTLKYPVSLHYDEDDDTEDDPESALGNTRTAGRNGRRSSIGGGSETADFIARHAYIGAGLAADELYYLNPTLKAGFDFLYGTLSYSIGDYRHWRYGIGASARINDRWRLHFEVNTGSTVKQDYNLISYDTLPPTDPDSIAPPVIVEKNTPLRVQSTLTRFTLSASWDMGSNFLISAGLTFNHLKNSYSSGGNSIALSNILPIGYDADKKYRTIKPPYELGNSYNGNNPSNVKTWIGVQISLIYRLSFFDR